MINISETLTVGLFDLKEKYNWSSEEFINRIARLQVPRQEIACFFDQCVQRKEMIALKDLEPNLLQSIRDRVQQFDLAEENEMLQLGKCIALVEQLKNGNENS